MHSCQPNFKAARILTIVIKWLNFKAVTVNLVITHSNDMEHLSSWQVYVFCFKIFWIHIIQHLILFIHFYINISNTIIIQIPVHMPDINRPSLEWLLVTPAYSTISYGNIKYYLQSRYQGKKINKFSLRLYCWRCRIHL